MQSDNLHQVEGRKSAMCRHNINSKNRSAIKGHIEIKLEAE